jgi:hypothetical protein
VKTRRARQESKRERQLRKERLELARVMNQAQADIAAVRGESEVEQPDAPREDAPSAEGPWSAVPSQPGLSRLDTDRDTARPYVHPRTGEMKSREEMERLLEHAERKVGHAHTERNAAEWQKFADELWATLYPPSSVPAPEGVFKCRGQHCTKEITASARYSQAGLCVRCLAVATGVLPPEYRPQRDPDAPPPPVPMWG